MHKPRQTSSDIIDSVNENAPQNLFDLLKRDEGLRLRVYLDSRGFKTGGWGHNIDAHGPHDLKVGDSITLDQAEQWLHDDSLHAAQELDTHLPWCKSLSKPRYAVLCSLDFNMGWGDGKHGLSSFDRFLSLVEAGEYETAADDLSHTLWAKQVGQRSVRLVRQLRTDQWV